MAALDRMDFETSNDISAKIYGLYSMLKRQRTSLQGAILLRCTKTIKLTITIAQKEMTSKVSFFFMKLVVMVS